MRRRAASKAERCRLIAESPSPRRTAPCILKTMLAVISLLRGINVDGHHPIKMDALRALRRTTAYEQAVNAAATQAAMQAMDSASAALASARATR